jgi:hypothetical protein
VRSKLVLVVLLSLAQLAIIGVAVASAEEYCVGGCTWGRNCPTQPASKSGGVELPLCILPPPEPPEETSPAPTPAIVEDEIGESTSDTTALVSASINSQGQGIQSIVWQYSAEAEVLGGEISLPPYRSEVIGSDPEGSAEGTITSSANLIRLEPGTTYYFRAVVTSRDGAVSHGLVESFDVLSAPAEPTPVGPVERTLAAPIEPAPAVPADETSTGPSMSSTPSSQSATTPKADIALPGSSPSRSPTDAQKRAKALKMCAARPRRKRERCDKLVESRYARRSEAKQRPG